MSRGLPRSWGSISCVQGLGVVPTPREPEDDLDAPGWAARAMNDRGASPEMNDRAPCCRCDGWGDTVRP
jgi:hypothetical protein